MRLRTIWDRRRYGVVVLCVALLGGCEGTSVARPLLTPSPSALASATASPSIAAPEPSPMPSADPVCRSPREHVYNPERLVLRDPCTSVSGTIEDINPETDGDYHILMRLDSQFEAMLNDGNRKNT
ncbi:MAG: hypothetical protein QOE92_1382, partial [Chloroflexota bacterium]|nr:hypothetical protein [Chloroflexota bacterium]